MDHYERLGLAREADARDVARAFRRAARDEHPDRGGDVERFRAIEEAYRVLVDPDLRRAYDRALDGTAHSWDDVEWGVDVAPAPRPAGTPPAAPDGEPDGGPDADPGGLDWDDDLGWGSDAVDAAPEGGGSRPDGSGRSRRLDVFVGGPVGLPDPLTPPPVVRPPRVGPGELATGLGAAALVAVALVTRWIATDATGDEDAALTPLVALTVVAIALVLQVHHPQSRAGVRLTWLLAAAAAVMWFVEPETAGSSGTMWASVVTGPIGVALAVWWAGLFRVRTRGPARVAALNRQNLGWRIDRHHRAEEWNRVRAALQVPGRVVAIVGPIATDAAGQPLRGRRWTFDPRTGAQEVRVVGPAAPQGSWVVVDSHGRVVATAPAWSPEAWLDALEEL